VLIRNIARWAGSYITDLELQEPDQRAIAGLCGYPTFHLGTDLEFMGQQ